MMRQPLVDRVIPRRQEEYKMTLSGLQRPEAENIMGALLKSMKERTG